MLKSHLLAGMMELADVADSKSTSPFPMPDATNPDKQGTFEN